MEKKKDTLKFVYIMTLVYVAIAVFNKGLFTKLIVRTSDIFSIIFPVFIVIFVLMIFSNYFITYEFVMKHLGKKGIKRWLYVIIAGILSSGPIYMWYPLLKDLKDKGLSSGLIATFLYNRAIKIPMIPIALVYFSLKYVIVLLIVMIVVSVVQGIVIEFLEKDNA
jgi:uncharacterized membrane protein YraQ (UPF0718 family)